MCRVSDQCCIVYVSLKLNFFSTRWLCTERLPILQASLSFSNSTFIVINAPFKQMWKSRQTVLGFFISVWRYYEWESWIKFPPFTTGCILYQRHNTIYLSCTVFELIIITRRLIFVSKATWMNINKKRGFINILAWTVAGLVPPAAQLKR